MIKDKNCLNKTWHKHLILNQAPATAQGDLRALNQPLLSLDHPEPCCNKPLQQWDVSLFRISYQPLLRSNSLCIATRLRQKLNDRHSILALVQLNQSVENMIVVLYVVSIAL